jgi:FkbH-like protein
MKQMNASEIRIAIAANFTAEPMVEVLRFWTETLGLGPVKIEPVGYNQVFQSLLDQASVFGSREPGVNFVLIRLEDWGRNQHDGRWLDVIRESVREFVAAIRGFAGRAARPTVGILCPASQQALAREGADAAFAPLEAELRQVFGECRMTLLDHAECCKLYPVAGVADPDSDRQGHIPFTAAYWAAIGTLLARQTRMLLQPPRKVVAVDADHTLWGEVAAETGAEGVDLSEPWRGVQAFLAQMKDRGMLLALVSKNRSEDVDAVFRRPEMVLRREDFAGWKVNWKPKSENLCELSAELELGLDSFIFLDDNPMECAEVQAHCPAVTVLQLPEPARASEFLKHAWIFDLPTATAVDSERTSQYREQAERKQLLAAAGSYSEFFEKLALKTDLFPPAMEQVERAAQLTQRTNQFNTTGLRRTVSELSVMLSSGERYALMAHVSDRFGDYGDVGLCVYSTVGSDLEVDTFLLSCRVLGKGVEYQMLAALGRAACQAGKARVVIPFRRTERNEPVLRFLETVGAAFRSGDSYCFPASAAACASFDPAAAAKPAEPEKTEASAAEPAASCDFGAIARGLGTVREIQSAIRRRYRRLRPDLPTAFVQSRNAMEENLVEIWTEVLGLDRVGVLDNFYDLGGDSIKSIQVLSRIHQAGLRLTLSQHYQFPVIAEQAPLLEIAASSTSAQPTARFSLARLGQKSMDSVFARLAKTGN